MSSSNRRRRRQKKCYSMSYAAANCSDCSVFRCALKIVIVAELFVDEDREFQTVGAAILNAVDCANCFSLCGP